MISATVLAASGVLDGLGYEKRLASELHASISRLRDAVHLPRLPQHSEDITPPTLSNCAALACGISASQTRSLEPIALPQLLARLVGPTIVTKRSLPTHLDARLKFNLSSLVRPTRATLLRYRRSGECSSPVTTASFLRPQVRPANLKKEKLLLVIRPRLSPRSPPSQGDALLPRRASRPSERQKLSQDRCQRDRAR